MSHVYRMINDGVVSECPSVTTILGKLIDKEFLRTWSAKKAVEKYHDDLFIGGVLNARQVRQEDAVNYPKQLAEQAMASGTKVHEAIEAFITTGAHPDEIFTNPPLNEEEQNAWDQWLRWYKKNDVEWVTLTDGSPAVELTVALFDEKKRAIYAGTLDAMAYVNGELTILDWKTSTGIWESYFPQLALYKLALHDCINWSLVVEISKKIDWESGEIVKCNYPDLNVHKANLAVLRIPKDGSPYEYKTKPYEKTVCRGKPNERVEHPYERAMNFGLSLVKAWHWMADRKLEGKPTIESVESRTSYIKF